MLKEMADRLALKMINEEVRASGLTINIKFADKNEPAQRATVRFKTPSNIASVLMDAAQELYLKKIKKRRPHQANRHICKRHRKGKQNRKKPL